MSDTLGSVGGVKIAQDNANLDQNRTDTWRTIYCYVLRIDSNDLTALVMLPRGSSYKFSNRIDTMGNDFSNVTLVGIDSNTRTYITSEWYWKYMVKMSVRTSSNSGAITATTGYLTTAPALAGIDWSIFDSTSTMDDRETKVRISDTVKIVVDNYNNIVSDLRTKHKDVGLSSSVPKPGTSEYKAFSYQYKSEVGKNLQVELERFRKQRESTVDLKGKVKSTKDMFKVVEPGLMVTDNGTSLTDRNGRELSKHTKVSLTSVYTSVDFKKARWNDIRARGRKFNKTMESVPSTMIQPLTAFVKAISDVEDIGISSLMAVYSIISLGQGFKGSGKPSEAGSTTSR